MSATNFSQIFFLFPFIVVGLEPLSHADVVTSQWKKLHDLYLKLASISLNFHKLNFKRDFLTGKKHYRSHFGDEEREGKKSCWKAAGREVKKCFVHKSHRIFFTLFRLKATTTRTFAMNRGKKVSILCTVANTNKLQVKHTPGAIGSCM